MEQCWVGVWVWEGAGNLLPPGSVSSSQAPLGQVGRIQKTQAAPSPLQRCECGAACPGGGGGVGGCGRDLRWEPPDWPVWLMEVDSRDPEETDQGETSCCSQAFIGFLLLRPHQSLLCSHPRCRGNHQSIPSILQACSCQSFFLPLLPPSSPPPLWPVGDRIVTRY